jgi:hypothetical protein
VFEAAITGEQLIVLKRAYKHDAGAGEASLGGVQQHAGDSHIGAQGDARENEHALWIHSDGARAPHTPVARFEQSGIVFARCLCDGLRKQADVSIAQRRLKAVR